MPSRRSLRCLRQGTLGADAGSIQGLLQARDLRSRQLDEGRAHDGALDAPGHAIVDFKVRRGLEYELAVAQATVAPGHSASITIPLVRFADQRAQGWYSGDMHVHMNYTRTFYSPVTPAQATPLVQAEDLAVTNFLAGNGVPNGPVYDEAYLTGQPVSVDART